MTEQQLQAALKKFEELVREQSERSDRIKADNEYLDYNKLDKIIVGVCGGDGIGPIITKESARVLEYMLADEVKAGKIEFKVIDGLTIENRIAKMKPSGIKFVWPSARCIRITLLISRRKPKKWII